MSAVDDYHLFGCRVRSAVPLPELLPWRGDSRQPDIIIKIGAVTAKLEGARPFSPAVQIGTNGRVRLAIPAVASYLIEDGTRVTIDPTMSLEAADIRVFLLETVLNILCFRRNLLPLHASAVEVSGRALLLAGDSGSGKSTLAAALTARGCRLLADNICALDFTSEGEPLIRPAFPQLKLWADAARYLTVTTEGLERSRAQLQKFHLPVKKEDFHSEPLPPAHVVLLCPSIVPEPFRLRRLRWPEAMRQRQIVHHWRLGVALGHGPAMFSALSKLLVASPLTELIRSADLTALQELADQIMALSEAA